MTIPIKLAFLWEIDLYNGVLYVVWRSPGFLPSPGEDQEWLPQGSQVYTEARKISRNRPGEEGTCARVCACVCIQVVWK